MKKWDVWGRVVGSKFLGTYEAETEDEAIENALRDAGATFCHQCDSECENPEIESAVAEEAE